MSEEQRKNRLLRQKEVLGVIPISKSTLWAWVNAGKFPKPVKLGEKTTCWKLSEIEAFIENGGWM